VDGGKGGGSRDRTLGGPENFRKRVTHYSKASSITGYPRNRNFKKEKEEEFAALHKQNISQRGVNRVYLEMSHSTL